MHTQCLFFFFVQHDIYFSPTTTNKYYNRILKNAWYILLDINKKNNLTALQIMSFYSFKENILGAGADSSLFIRLTNLIPEGRLQVVGGKSGKIYQKPAAGDTLSINIHI